jgi:hypothetical protein
MAARPLTYPGRICGRSSGGRRWKRLGGKLWGGLWQGKLQDRCWLGNLRGGRRRDASGKNVGENEKRKKENKDVRMTGGTVCVQAGRAAARGVSGSTQTWTKCERQIGPLGHIVCFGRSAGLPFLRFYVHMDTFGHGLSVRVSPFGMP